MSPGFQKLSDRFQLILGKSNGSKGIKGFVMLLVFKLEGFVDVEAQRSDSYLLTPSFSSTPKAKAYNLILLIVGFEVINSS